MNQSGWEKTDIPSSGNSTVSAAFFRLHKSLFITVDLLIQPVQGFLHFLHPRQQLIPLFYEQHFSGIDSGITLLEQGHIFYQGLNLHARFAHALHQFNPAAGIFIIIPYSALISGYLGNQADTFVIPQCIRRHLIFLTYLCNSHDCPPFS